MPFLDEMFGYPPPAEERRRQILRDLFVLLLDAIFLAIALGVLAMGAWLLISLHWAGIP